MTILTNILVTNLQSLDPTGSFVDEVIENRSDLQKLKPNGDGALFVGQCLLKEFAFKFITYVQEEVPCKRLSTLLCKEYFNILSSLLEADRLALKITAENYPTFFEAKRKKMNLTMMLLCDCISATEMEPPLHEYIVRFGEVCEVRAMAFKDLQAQVLKPNNLFAVWNK